MKKKLKNNNISETFIINKFLNKLNFDKKGTYDFRNDGAYIKIKKNQKLIVTTDSISQNLDFFKNDNPKSIAYKVVTVNLSDLSAMGATPHSYVLNLFLPNFIDAEWLKIFTSELLRLQKKYNFYLLGGDLSKANYLSVSGTFFGLSKNNNPIVQNKVNLNDDIWITGNLGDSYIGLQILKNKIKLDENMKKYFTNMYYFPKACFLGYKFSNLSKSMKDISDGFIGDLNKMLNMKYGAKIFLENLPISSNLKKILNKKLVNIDNILNCGDCYQLIIISNKKFRNKILSTAKNNNLKISRVGKVIKKFKIIGDSNYTLNIPREFDHFL